MRKIILISILIIYRNAGAQQLIRFEDNEKNGISDVVVSIHHLNSDEKTIELTNQNGEIATSFDFPILIKTSHISFFTLLDTLHANPKTITLEKKEVELNEVVVTGQINPQSAKSSVYSVRTISKDRIVSQGATQLQDILANELNINFSRDNALGSSSLSLQGMSGQNVKILVDGIPMVGRSGVANEVDINQINVNSIEKVEIVEGPMAVNFGADALAGVINIITRKDSDDKFNAFIGIHEETVGDEYSFFETGIHSPSLIINAKPHKNWFLQGETRINRFGGWIGNGTNRNRQWYPKTQTFGGGLIQYEKKNFNIHYRYDQLSEVIENLGEINDANAFKDPFAIDEEYRTRRSMHQIQSEINLRKWVMNPVLSFTNYSRNTYQFTRNLITNETQQTVEDEQDTITFNSLFFRNTLSNVSRRWGSIQLGLETTAENASGTTLNDGAKKLFDVAVFVSSEISLGEKLKARPGIRYGYNSIYPTIPTPSINLKYELNKAMQVRIGYGRGFRAPSLRELYHEFIDANHNIVGNTDLAPEVSHNINGELSYALPYCSIESTFSGFYNYVENKITFFTPEQSNAATSYLNLDVFKTTGLRLLSSAKFSNLSVAMGVAYTGRYQQLNNTGDIPQYLFGWEANSNLTYEWIKTGLNFNTFYKYTGALQDYRLVNDTPELQQIDGFHMLDASVSRNFRSWGTLIVGARNILDIDFVNNNLTGGVHSGGGPQTSVGYGRSYFIKLNIQLSN